MVSRCTFTEQDRERVLELRRQAEVIASAADMLPDDDAELVLCVFDAGECVEAIAKRRGVTARTLQRRLQVILRRLASQECKLTLLVAGALVRPADEVAVGRWVRGESMREIGGRLGLTLAEVRRWWNWLDGYMEGLKHAKAR